MSYCCCVSGKSRTATTTSPIINSDYTNTLITSCLDFLPVLNRRIFAAFSCLCAWRKPLPLRLTSVVLIDAT